MSKLSFKQSALAGISLGIVVGGAYAPPALAVTPTGWIYMGGATFPERAYRDVFNCYSNHSGTDTETGLTSHICSTGDTGFVAPYKPAIQMLYAGVGSGNGKSAWINHNAGNLTNGGRVPDSVPVPSTLDKQNRYVLDGNVTTGWGTNWAANKGTFGPFATIAIVGSDDPLLPTDLTDAGKYNDNSAANSWGPAIQVPSLIGTVALMYSPAGNVTWTEAGQAPSSPIGNFSLVSLKTNTWCGVMTRAITDWNDPEITTDNGGTSITGNVSAPITVVVRDDGSGTTFLMANALIQQCQNSTHPVPGSWQTATGNALGVSNNSWFKNVDVASGNTTFVRQSGSGGITTYVNTHPGSVGYASVDFAQPVNSAGPKAMNLQTYDSFNNNTQPDFKQPNKASGVALMTGVLPPQGNCTTAATYAKGTSPDGKCAHNPVNWGVTVPKPGNAAAYPIGGFTFMFAYSCYGTVVNGGLTTAPRLVGNVGKVGFFRWYYGLPAVNGSKVVNALAKNGFAPVPPLWRTAINTLLFTDVKTKIAAPGANNSACAGLTNGPGKGA